MASHGRRTASNRTKKLKEIKRMQRENNTRVRKMGKYASQSNAVKYQNNNGNTAFKRRKGGHYTAGEINKYYYSSKNFQQQKTSTKKGTMKAMSKTLETVLSIGSAQADYIIKTIENKDDASQLIIEFFGVYSSVVDYLEAYGLYGIIQSGDIVDLINKVVDSKVDKIQSANTTDLINSRTATLSDDGLIFEVVERLKNKYSGSKLLRNRY